ncbi:MAG: SpoIIE family protein phosphatase [Acidobacteria bacterium]|nr:SpoIIE family protein phosphatase [Acidobacteriota bacterium]MBV9475911.1 SpoIIE family protein phosphatase [Acidobacteriota bacterium]
MSDRRKVTLFVIIAIAVAGLELAYGIVRLRHWRHAGTAGVTYIQEYTRGEQGAKPGRVVMGLQPGMVIMLDPSGGARAGGMHVRDVVKAIDGIPMYDQPRLRALDMRVHTGDVITFRVERGGKLLDIPVRLASPIGASYLFAFLTSIFVAIVFVAIGIFVFSRSPGDRRARVFCIMTSVGAVSIVGTAVVAIESLLNMRGIFTAPLTSVFPLLALLAGAYAFAPLTLHLALIFPRERPIVTRAPHVLRWVYGVPASAVAGVMVFLGTSVLFPTANAARLHTLETAVHVCSAALAVIGMFVALRIAYRGRTEGTRHAFALRPLQTIFSIVALFLGLARIFMALHLKWAAVVVAAMLVLLPFPLLAVYPILACIALYRSYRDAGAEERRQVQWPLWGTLIALAARLVIAFISQLVVAGTVMRGGDVSWWLRAGQFVQVVPTLLYLLIPISFAFAILKYRLMNIDVIIRKTVVYAILTGAILVLYVGIVGGLGALLVNIAHVQNQTLVIASTLVVALLFVPLRTKLQTLVDRNLFRHKYEYPEALRAIGAETMAAHDLGAYLGGAAEELQHALQNRAVVLFVERQEEFVAVAKVGVADALLGRLRVPRTFSEFLDRPFDPRRRTLPEAASAPLAKIEATLVVPIGTRGFVALAPKLSGGEFDVEDIDFLRSAADQISIATDRIRMAVDEADFTQARAIQQTLLPREMPRVAGIDASGVWQPARSMGGDYYDLIKLGERELAVCIGDVAGKGMPAALLMSGLQAAVRASASGSPRDLCERVRRVVVSSLSGGRFVTFFYATLDTASMTLRWCNAGHNAPVLARADGTIVRLAEGGPAISRLFTQPYEERELAVAPGDTLVLFTDGVSEAGDGEGELFGEQRIEELVADARDLSAEELQQTLVDAATSFARGELEDDLTLVVVALR